jgi:hypothetical protein
MSKYVVIETFVGSVNQCWIEVNNYMKQFLQIDQNIIRLYSELKCTTMQYIKEIGVEAACTDS